MTYENFKYPGVSNLYFSRKWAQALQKVNLGKVRGVLSSEAMGGPSAHLFLFALWQYTDATDWLYAVPECAKLLSELQKLTVVAFDQWLRTYISTSRVWWALPPVDEIFKLAKCYDFKETRVEWRPEEVS